MRGHFIPVAAAVAVGCEPAAEEGGVAGWWCRGGPMLAKRLPRFPHLAR